MVEFLQMHRSLCRPSKISTFVALIINFQNISDIHRDLMYLMRIKNSAERLLGHLNCYKSQVILSSL